MSKRWRWLGLALIAVVAIVFGIARRARSQEAGQPAAAGPKAAVVSVAEPQHGKLARTLELTGTVAAEAEIGLYAKLEQPIRWIEVREGDEVKAGAVLVRLDSAEMEAQLASALADQRLALASLQDVLAGTRPEDLAQAEAAVRQAEAAAARAAAAERNAKAIYGGQRVGAPRQAVEEAEGKLAVAQAQREAAEAAVGAARKNLAETRQLANLNTPQVQAVNEARGKVDVAQSQLAEAGEKAASAESQVAEARARVTVAEAQVAESTQKVAVARAQIAAADPAVANARAEYDRAVALLKIGGLSPEETDRAKLRLQTAEAQLDSAQGGLKLAEAQERAARSSLAMAQAQLQTSTRNAAATRTQVTTANSVLRTAEESLRLASALLDTSATPNQQVADAEGRLEIAEAQLKAAQAAEAAATKALQQVQALQGGPLPRRELDEAAGRVAETQAAAQAARQRLAALRAGATPTQVAVAQARVDQATARVGYWQTQVALCTLTAPISGVVIDRLKDIGDKSDPKQPLLVIAQAGRQLVRTAVSDREAAELRPGQAARVVLDAMPDHPLSTTVTNVFPAAEDSTGLVPVELLLPPLPRTVADGGFARIEIEIASAQGLLLPATALVEAPDGTVAVFVATPEDTAEQRPVEVGLEQGQQVVVSAGLSPGERVVVGGQERLKDGQKVKIAGAGGGAGAGAGRQAGGGVGASGSGKAQQP